MNRREAIKLAREKCQDTPSAEAIALAVKLSGHTHCQRALATQSGTPYKPEHFVCDGCLGDAATIESALKLKERDAVIFAAETLVRLDAQIIRPRNPNLALYGAINTLAEALRAL